MLLLQICNRCKALLNVKALQQMREASSTHIVNVSKQNDQVLKKLGFKERDYIRVLPRKRTVRELNLQRVMDMLFKLGFTAAEIRKQPNVLWLHPFLIDQRFKILEESGVERKKITLGRISRYPKLNTTTIHDLKKNSFISQETDLVHRILSFSNIPQELYPPKTNDEEVFGNVQTCALQTYLSWLLGFSREEVEKKYQSYVELYQKSVRLVMQCNDILINRFEMPEHKIKKNIFLLGGHPDNFLEILERIPQIGGVTIQHVASTNPKILKRPVYKMLKVLDILKKYNIPEESIATCSNVLTLSPETVSERVAALHADPVFNPFFCNPRICFVICRYHTSVSRSRLLKDMKWKCLSLQILTSFHQDFQKRIDLGHDGSRGIDTIHYIKKNLGYENKEIRNQLKLHPFFCLVPVTVVSDTLQLLLRNGIDKSEIFKALPIVLYPKEKVARWLEKVYCQPEVQGMRDEEGRISPSLLLQLVLYYMERPYEFSGHGVWSEQDHSNSPYLQ